MDNTIAILPLADTFSETPPSYSTSLSKDIHYLTISDLHLGHRRNKAAEIIKNLDVFFDYYTAKSQFATMDIIFLAGDVFDQLLEFSNDDIHDIALWLGRLMDFCRRFNIKLRILEGTPSHDWKQSRIAQTISAIAMMSGADLDFRYIDTIHIEFLKDLQLHILYVPDEATSDVSLTFSHVQQLMAEMHIEQVDIAIMHGMFSYQLKNIPGNAHKHLEVDYLGVVKYFINIGHIHTFSTYDRIIAQGSFDRLSHGEEEAKGGVVCTLGAIGDNYFNFIENKGAKIFKTIEIRHRDLDKSLEQIQRVLGKIPENSFIRIKARKDHPLYIAFEELKLKFPMYYFTKADIEAVESGQQQIINAADGLEEMYTPITITTGNIVDLLTEAIKSKHKLTESRLHLLNEVLESNR